MPALEDRRRILSLKHVPSFGCNLNLQPLALRANRPDHNNPTASA